MEHNCPLCDKPMLSLHSGSIHKGFHYWCEECNHGWYIADLQNIVGMRLRGKLPEEIRGIILAEDKRKEDTDGVKEVIRSRNR